ncbi:MAG: hypothetical protein V8R91_17690 [Butyricimonas faecihominis]
MNIMINIAAAMMNTRFGELAQQEGCPFASAHLQNVPLTNTCDALELQVMTPTEMLLRRLSPQRMESWNECDVSGSRRRNWSRFARES